MQRRSQGSARRAMEAELRRSEASCINPQVEGVSPMKSTGPHSLIHGLSGIALNASIACIEVFSPSKLPAQGPEGACSTPAY